MFQTETSPISLGNVTPQEYNQIIEVWEASVRGTHHFVTEEEIQFFRPLILEEYLWLMRLTCAKDQNGKILGFSGVLDGKLEMLFLHPEARGRGIGKRLLKHAIEQGNITKVDVNEENSQAVGFYLHQGFEVAGRSEVDGLGKPHPILHLQLARR
ncbi:GNAT family N-acetyltransferase [Rufibacter psychrotolerans]|uniref:GNAT family N-acetyltransferase n=1 Tax=Rufibacter psychrotolerans TaxID=2812556 RepID=UPI00196763C8|nr:GNAT family N-acetyltransferase [Rufibacter sp. SYSU D00308]